MKAPVLLFAFANNSHDVLHKLKAEQEAILHKLAGVIQEQMVEVHVIEAASRANIWAFFNDPVYSGRIVLFHFGGHAGDFGLSMELPDGSSRKGFAQGFAAFLGPQPNLELVILNGCATAPQAEGLLAAGIDAVISTSQAIRDEAALVFSTSLYESLGSGDDLRRAFEEASAALMADFDTSLGFRKLYLDGPAPEAELLNLLDQPPWRLEFRAGAERMEDWNLPEISGNPLFNLPPLSHLPLPASPFRFLRWYNATDARVFFGRDYQIRKLYEWILDPFRAPVIHLYGQSGVGKSSLLVAGILPRLEATHQAIYVRRNPAKGIVGSLVEEMGLRDKKEIIPYWQRLCQSNKKPLLILDQVEEVFTRAWPGGTAAAELAELTHFLETIFRANGQTDKPPKAVCILAYRKEFLAELETHFQMAQLPKEKFFLERLKRRGVMQAIRGLANRASLHAHYGLQIEEDPHHPEPLAEQIADDMLSDPASPVAPVLQILLSNMWIAAKKASSPNPVFTPRLYRSIREKGIWIRDFLQNQLNTLRNLAPEASQSGWLLDLLHFHTTELGTATSRSLKELEAAYLATQASSHSDMIPLKTLLQLLQDHYLLIAPDQSGLYTRLAHDTLAPLVLDALNRSIYPAQQAHRVLRSQLAINVEARLARTLDSLDLNRVQKGRKGMRQLSPQSLALLAQSIVREERKLAFGIRQELGTSLHRKFPSALSTQVLLESIHQGLSWHIPLHQPLRFWAEGDDKSLRIDAHGNLWMHPNRHNLDEEALRLSNSDIEPIIEAGFMYTPKKAEHPRSVSSLYGYAASGAITFWDQDGNLRYTWQPPSDTLPKGPGKAKGNLKMDRPRSIADTQNGWLVLIQNDRSIWLVGDQEQAAKRYKNPTKGARMMVLLPLHQQILFWTLDGQLLRMPWNPELGTTFSVGANGTVYHDILDIQTGPEETYLYVFRPTELLVFRLDALEEAGLEASYPLEKEEHLRISPDGKWLLKVSDSHWGEAILLASLKEGKPLSVRFNSPHAGVTHIGWEPLSAHLESTRFWTLAGGVLHQWSLQHPSNHRLPFLPQLKRPLLDDEWFLGPEGQIGRDHERQAAYHGWQVIAPIATSTGNNIRSAEDHITAAVEISRKGKRWLIMGTGGGDLLILDEGNRNPRHMRSGQKASRARAAFERSLGNMGTEALQTWQKAPELAMQQILNRIEGHIGPVNGLYADAAGNILSSGQDAQLKYWTWQASEEDKPGLRLEAIYQGRSPYHSEFRKLIEESSIGRADFRQIQQQVQAPVFAETEALAEAEELPDMMPDELRHSPVYFRELRSGYWHQDTGRWFLILDESSMYQWLPGEVPQPISLPLNPRFRDSAWNIPKANMISLEWSGVMRCYGIDAAGSLEQIWSVPTDQTQAEYVSFNTSGSRILITGARNELSVWENDGTFCFRMTLPGPQIIRLIANEDLSEVLGLDYQGYMHQFCLSPDAVMHYASGNLHAVDLVNMGLSGWETNQAVIPE